MKDFLKKLGYVVFELAIIGLIVFIIFQRKGMHVSDVMPTVKQAQQAIGLDKFPEASQPTKKTYTWQFKGDTYRISETLYTSIYAYYKSQPKTYSYIGTLADDWEEQYYGMFLKENKHDQTIAIITKDIVEQGKKHALNDDQIVELVMAFVQSIPYDDSKARNILTNAKDETVQYPYETLFVNSGVCSDKSFLAAALVRSLGYGTALFIYEDDNHMAIGIQCPKQYSTYQSGYCYAETTSTGNKIGIIPDLDSNSNRVATLKTIDTSDFDSRQGTLKQLGDVKMYQKSSGKTYAGVTATLATEKEIKALKNDVASINAELQKKRGEIVQREKRLESMKKELDALKNKDDYKAFNAMVSKYNSLLEDYQDDIASFNKKVNTYNQKVNRYNTLLQE